MERKKHILLFGGNDEYEIMENSTQEEVKKECSRFDKFGNYDRKGVTAYILPEPILKIDEYGDILLDKTNLK